MVCASSPPGMYHLVIKTVGKLDYALANCPVAKIFPICIYESDTALN